jgi:hypothetical protein
MTRNLLRCMSPEVALFGHAGMSALSPLSAAKRKLDFGVGRSEAPKPDHNSDQVFFCWDLPASTASAIKNTVTSADGSLLMRACASLNAL